MTIGNAEHEDQHSQLEEDRDSHGHGHDDSDFEEHHHSQDSLEEGQNAEDQLHAANSRNTAALFTKQSGDSTGHFSKPGQGKKDKKRHNTDEQK